MILKATYGGYDLTQHCVIRAVKPHLTAPVRNNFLSNANLNGAQYRNRRYGQIALDIEITIKNDVMWHRDKLNEILFTREPKPLIISDQPDRQLLCLPEGQVTFSSRFHVADAKITFISPNSYWNSTQGVARHFFTNGNIMIENRGTHPIKPSFDIVFPNDCGYLSVVAPNGFITLGNPFQEDTVNVPRSEYAMNEEMHEVGTWQRITNGQTWIPDYKKMTTLGNAKHDQWGMQLDTSTLSGAGRWNGHAFVRGFDTGTIEKYADDFNLKSRVDISNTGDRRGTMSMLIVVMDDDNVPLMTTSIYDAWTDKNELMVTFKIPDTRQGKNKESVILRGYKVPNLNGYVTMEKIGSSLFWKIHNDKTQSTVTGAKLSINQNVHIKKSAKYAETGHPILAGYHDKTYTIGAVKTGADGSKAYRLDNGGWAIYWIYERDIVESTKTITSSSPQTFRFNHYSSFVGQRKASKVFVYQGKWGEGPTYNQFSLNSVVVQRRYAKTNIDVENTFMMGDHLHINNETNEVLLNGVDFTGEMDVDNKFFEVDGGRTAVMLQASTWATMPIATADYESRWF